MTRSMFLLLVCSSLWFSTVFSQMQAPVNVLCTDKNGKNLAGEQILFKSEKTLKVTEGVTDDNGRFNCTLNGPDQYMIIVKSLTGMTDYTRFILPTLKQGQRYGTYEITVEIEPAETFTLDNVYFETGSSVLKKESFPELNELVEFMNRKKNAVIEIGGHTDDQGNDEDNLKLSQERAASVKKFLVQKGISENRVRPVGYGESRPVASNDTELGRQRNRRTEVRILGN